LLTGHAIIDCKFIVIVNLVQVGVWHTETVLLCCNLNISFLCTDTRQRGLQELSPWQLSRRHGKYTRHIQTVGRSVSTSLMHQLFKSRLEVFFLVRLCSRCTCTHFQKHSFSQYVENGWNDTRI